MAIYKSMKEVSKRIEEIVAERRASVKKVEYADAKKASYRIRKAVKKREERCFWNDMQLSQLHPLCERLVAKSWTITKQWSHAPQKPMLKANDLKSSAWPKRRFFVDMASPCGKYILHLTGTPGYWGGHLAAHLLLEEHEEKKQG